MASGKGARGSLSLCQGALACMMRCAAAAPPVTSTRTLPPLCSRAATSSRIRPTTLSHSPLSRHARRKPCSNPILD